MATLQTRITDFITAVGTDIKQIRTWITGSSTGTLSALNTTDKTSLINAINEVRTAALSDQTVQATTSVAGKAALATNAEALAGTDATKILTPAALQSMMNVNNGIPKLDGTGKVAAAQLPAYVDDVLEFANLAAFPGTGSTGILYVDIATGKVYRWSGTAYVEISGSPGSTDAVPEGSVNLYYTNARADARVNSAITAQLGNPDTDLVAAYTAAKA